MAVVSPTAAHSVRECDTRYLEVTRCHFRYYGDLLAMADVQYLLGSVLLSPSVALQRRFVRPCTYQESAPTCFLPLIPCSEDAQVSAGKASRTRGHSPCSPYMIQL